MGWQLAPYAPAIVLAGLVNGAIAVYSARRLRRKRDRMLVAYTVLMFSMTGWSLLYAVRLSSTDMATKWLVYRIDLFPQLLAVAWVAFTASYAGRDRWLRHRWIAAYAAGPVLFNAVLLPTNGIHGLVVADATVASPNGVEVFVAEWGPLFWPHIVWLHVLLLLGLYFLVSRAISDHSLYRGQVVTVITAAVLPVLANLAYLSDLGPYQNVNLTSAAFAVSGILMWLGIVRYRMLDIVPVARDTVIEGMRDGYLVVDEQDRMVDANPAARTLVGVDPIVGRPVGEAFPDDVDLPLDGDENRSTTEITLTVDGERRHFEVDTSGLGNDRLDGHLLTFRDVTDRRAVERRFQTLIENASDVITVLDAEGIIRYQSPSVERVLGWDPEDHEGDAAFEYVHPEDRDRLRSEFQRGVEDPSYTVRIEYRFRAASGEWRVLESVGMNLLDDPDVEGIVINSRDVTERRARERELERKNDRLEEFASVVSHDLRNPLNVAYAYLEMAAEGDEDAFEEVESSLDRMGTIVDDVLTLARQGEEVGETLPVSLGVIANDAWSTVETGEASLTLEGDVELDADPERLRQLFENLFRNAVEHGTSETQERYDATDGDPAATVRVGPLDDGFYVEDDGPGIDPEDRDTVFESGYTTATDGTGFGLAIVERIANAHGWEVTATASRDGGARFEFDLVDDPPGSRTGTVSETVTGDDRQMG